MEILSSLSVQVGSYTSKKIAAVEPKETLNTPTSPHQPSITTNTQVDISKEGREKLEQEQKELGQKLATQLNPKEEKEDEISESQAIETLNKLIKEVQKKIKALQQELSTLDNQQTEEADIQRKALEAELTSLNSTLIGLISKKMDAIKEETT